MLAAAASIVQAAEEESRELSAAEDSFVLELMTRVKDFEEEIGHLKRKARRT